MELQAEEYSISFFSRIGSKLSSYSWSSKWSSSAESDESEERMSLRGKLGRKGKARERIRPLDKDETENWWVNVQEVSAKLAVSTKSMWIWRRSERAGDSSSFPSSPTSSSSTSSFSTSSSDADRS